MSAAVESAPTIASSSPAFASLLIDRLRPSPTNPRKRFDEADLNELADSIRQHGIISPILVRPIVGTDDYEIVAGERRFRAAAIAGLQQIPVLVQALTDGEVLELQVVENLQRADLHPLEEADGYDTLIKRGIHNVDSLAARVGKSKSYVYQRVTLARLCEAGRKAMFAGKLTPSVALLVARMPQTDLQDRAVKALLGSIRYFDTPDAVVALSEARRIIHQGFMLRLATAAFDPKDAELKPGAGACTDCPKRSGATPELFPDIEKANTCSDPDCFHEKTRLHGLRAAEAARAKGREILEGDAARKLKPHEHGGIKGYVELNKPLPETGGKQTAKQLLGRDFAPTVFIDPHNGQATEVAPERAIAAALERAGIKVGKPGKSPDEVKRERRRRIETAYRHELLARIREPREYTVADALFVAVSMLELLDSDGRGRLFKLRGWVGANGSGLDELVARECPPADLPRLMIEAALISETYVSPWESDSSKPRRMLELAERLGIDPAEVRKDAIRRVADEDKAKASNAGARGKKRKPAATAGDSKPTTPAADTVPTAPTDTQTPGGETAPPVAGADPAEIRIGDRYQVREDARGPNGMFRKCAGRVGTIQALPSSRTVLLRTGPRNHEVVVVERHHLVAVPAEESTS